MNQNSLAEWVLYLCALLVVVRPLGRYMAHVFSGTPTGLSRLLGPVERLLYRACRIDSGQEMDAVDYTKALLLFNLAGALALYALERLQGVLPLNPGHFPGLPPALAFNTAISFVSNTNWQNYAGETTMSYLTQMLGLSVQNFLSAGTGIAAALALIRGIARHSATTVGNFWVDVTRSVLYVLLPLSLVFALVLSAQGVIQNLARYQSVTLIAPFSSTFASGAADAPVAHRITHQILPMGPVASQEAIKELGTNGGGFFNANSAHPYENPTPLTNFLEALAILAIPAALTYTFGAMVGDKRQGWTLFFAMALVFFSATSVVTWAEQQPPASCQGIGVSDQHSALQAGGNMEGKETRFGITGSALFATATTAASCGAVNAMTDSFAPVGGLIPLWLIQLGEVIFGGVGSGLYGILIFAILAVFVAGLLIGRTPEYLGKKIESYEMKMASIAILITPFLVLGGTALAVMTAAGRSAPLNPGPHGFTEILYALSSAANNNGSAFAGASTGSAFYNVLLAVVMWLGRFGTIVPTLAIAGSLAAKKRTQPTAGTLPTHGVLFAVLLIGTVVLVGALTYVPALALGPIAEQMNAAGTR